MSDTIGAFMPGPRLTVAGAKGGPLKGLTFAVKDLIDVAGEPTGFGNPDWAATHPVPERNAWVIDRLLGAGASVAGKTVLDELAYSLEGRNIHYGAPKNARAPGRITGGSSSGSAGCARSCARRIGDEVRRARDGRDRPPRARRRRRSAIARARSGPVRFGRLSGYACRYPTLTRLGL